MRKVVKVSQFVQDTEPEKVSQPDALDWNTTLLCLFLITDVSFIALYLIYIYTGLTSNYAFSLEVDRGYSEIFQYVKEYWSALLLGLLAVKHRSWLYSSWSLLFFYLLLDDAARIHEVLGNILSRTLALPTVFALKPQDLGELTVSAGVGLCFLIAIILTYRMDDRPARAATRHLIRLLLGLAIVGIVADMLHTMINVPALLPLFVLLEDGGEMIVMSYIVCFVLSLPWRQSGDRTMLG